MRFINSFIVISSIFPVFLFLMVTRVSKKTHFPVYLLLSAHTRVLPQMNCSSSFCFSYSLILVKPLSIVMMWKKFSAHHTMSLRDLCISFARLMYSSRVTISYWFAFFIPMSVLPGFVCPNMLYISFTFTEMLLKSEISPNNPKPHVIRAFVFWTIALHIEDLLELFLCFGRCIHVNTNIL